MWALTRILRPRAYGIIHAINYLTSWTIWCNVFAHRFPQIGDSSEIMFVGLILAGLAGARTMCVLQRDIHLRDWFKFHKGGQSSFGGFYGGLLYMLLVAWWYTLDILLFVECMGLCIAAQIPLGRLANWINGELGGCWSRVLGCRHPVQLYQMALEGLFVNAVAWSMVDHVGSGDLVVLVSGVYCLARVLCEPFKVPDRTMPNWFRNSLNKWMTLGQLQALLLPIAGSIFVYLIQHI